MACGSPVKKRSRRLGVQSRPASSSNYRPTGAALRGRRGNERDRGKRRSAEDSERVLYGLYLCYPREGLLCASREALQTGVLATLNLLLEDGLEVLRVAMALEFLHRWVLLPEKVKHVAMGAAA